MNLTQMLNDHQLWLQGNGGKCADLRRADLQNARLRDADLWGADFRGADLRGADLWSTNLQDADLRGANLWGADLQGADLRGADLRRANLQGANLRRANLQGANLRRANLQGANLQAAQNISPLAAARLLRCPPEGSFVAWKRCRDSVIVKLLIPADAQRSSATSCKCRASCVQVLEVIPDVVGVSIYDARVLYRKGETIRCDKWDNNRWEECGGGIHFYMSREEAEMCE
jgi:hypothetical protein